MYGNASASVAVSVVQFSRSYLAAYSYPGSLPKTELYLLGCSGEYQRARLSSTGVLTNGVSRDITAYSAFVSNNSYVACSPRPPSRCSLP